MKDQDAAPGVAPSRYTSRWTGSKVLEADHRRTRQVLFEELALERSDRVLEIGCGPGIWAREAGQLAGAVTAVDVLEVRVEEARANTAGLPVEVVHGDFLDVPIEGSFTKIFSSRTIEYIHDHDRLARRLGELLAPGGTLVLITKPRFSIWRGRARLLRRRPIRRPAGENAPQKLLSPGQLIAMLAPHGVSPVRVRPVVMRPPVFQGGFNEIPLIPDSMAAPALRASDALFRLASRPPLKLAALPLLLSESYCITFSKSAQ